MVDLYKNWIFDWSGTVVDDMEIVVDATNHVMSQYEKPLFDRESFKASFRLPYGEWYADLLPGVDLNEIEGHFRKGFAYSDATVPVLPHAREFLHLLKARGCRLFVCTSMDSDGFTDQANKHELTSLFEQTYSGVLDKRALIGEMLESHQLDLANTVFVGDMIHDIETAHHGNIASIAVLTGYNSHEELSSVNPTHLIPDYSSLL